MASKKHLDDLFTSKTESMIFGRNRTSCEPFGVYRKLAIAQTTSPAIARVCQDGGVVTALLAFALEKGTVEGAMVTGTDPEKLYYPIPKLATNFQDVLDAAGSKYTCSQSPLALVSEVRKQMKARVAFVGAPCQIRALRHLQMVESQKFDFAEFSIGLMCSSCFRHELITEFVQKKLGINPRDILKMNIKQRLMITTRAGVTEAAISEIEPYKQKGCGVCRDFSSELADISVGGLGLIGWSFTIIRSERGDELFSGAEKAGFLRTKTVSSEDKAYRLLVKVSRKKRECRDSA